MKKVANFMSEAEDIIRLKFKFATLNFLFVMTFVSVMPLIFGASNSIVAIIFIQIMLSTSSRDITASLGKHFMIQTIVLLCMAIGACISVNIAPIFAIPLNIINMFLLLYAYTYEYLDNMYFPYILSYLFLICLAPITYAQLPLRMVMMITGSCCIITYQWFIGRGRIVNTSKSVLLTITREANICIRNTLHQQPFEKDYQKLRSELCKLSKLIYDRRKKNLCISDAAFATIDVGRGLEELLIQLAHQNQVLTPIREALFHQITFYLSCFEAYVLEERSDIPSIDFSHLPSDHIEVQESVRHLNYIRDHLYTMKMQDKKEHYQPTFFSFKNRIASALHVSQVRFLYALRVSLLLAFALYAVQVLHLEHGRWLLFTLASVSLPYADDIKTKAKKRIIATVCGGIIGFVCFSLVNDSTIRTILLLSSGYIMFYLSDYATSFTFGTIGALGGSIMGIAFGANAVAHIVWIRFFYIIIGIVIAYIVNVFICPMRREKATRILCAKYQQTSTLLSELCKHEEVDKQLYYNLILQIFLQEEMIRKHASSLQWNQMNDYLEEIQKNVRLAHRKHSYIAS